MASEATELPQNLLTALEKVVLVLDRLRIRYALIGGIALAYRGEPRFTQDVDFLLDIPQLVLPGLLEELRALGFTLDTEVTIREWTQDHLTALEYHGVCVDWLKPVLPCMRRALETATAEPWCESTIRVVRVESLILLKLLAFREQDQLDIANLLSANRGELDLDLVHQECASLGLLDDERWQKFEEMVARRYTAP